MYGTVQLQSNTHIAKAHVLHAIYFQIVCEFYANIATVWAASHQ